MIQIKHDIPIIVKDRQITYLFIGQLVPINKTEEGKLDYQKNSHHKAHPPQGENYCLLQEDQHKWDFSSLISP